MFHKNIYNFYKIVGFSNFSPHRMNLEMLFMDFFSRKDIVVGIRSVPPTWKWIVLGMSRWRNKVGAILALLWCPIPYVSKVPCRIREEQLWLPGFNFIELCSAPCETLYILEPSFGMTITKALHYTSALLEATVHLVTFPSLFARGSACPLSEVSFSKWKYV